MRRANSSRVRLPFFLSKSLKTFHRESLFLVMILHSLEKQFWILALV
jgi:hypothetical protein